MAYATIMKYTRSSMWHILFLIHCCQAVDKLSQQLHCNDYIAKVLNEAGRVTCNTTEFANNIIIKRDLRPNWLKQLQLNLGASKSPGVTIPARAIRIS